MTEDIGEKIQREEYELIKEAFRDQKAVVKFAFYYPGAASHQFPPTPAYYVEESTIPGLEVGRNVLEDVLVSHGVEIPFTPDFNAWVIMGSPIYKGKGAV